MAFKTKPTKNKTEMLNKSLYIRADLAEKVNEIARENDTSFNNTVISILEDFFEREERKSE